MGCWTGRLRGQRSSCPLVDSFEPLLVDSFKPLLRPRFPISLQARGGYATADAVYQQGINVLAAPVERLRAKYAEFQQRMVKHSGVAARVWPGQRFMSLALCAVMDALGCLHGRDAFSHGKT